MKKYRPPFLSRSCTDNHSFCEFMSTWAMSVPEDIIMWFMSPGSVPLGHPWEGRWQGTIHPCPYKEVCPQRLSLSSSASLQVVCLGFGLSRNIKRYLISCVEETASPSLSLDFQLKGEPPPTPPPSVASSCLKGKQNRL